MVLFAENDSLDRKAEEEAFRATFAALRESAGSNSFRKYDAQKQRFVGGFLVSAYEAVGIGLGTNYDSKVILGTRLEDKIKEMWSDEEFRKSSRSGVPASSRVPRTVAYGRKLFSE